MKQSFCFLTVAGILFTGGLLNAQPLSSNQGVIHAPPMRPAMPPPPQMPPAAEATIEACLAWDATTKEITVSNGTPEAHFFFNLTNISSGDVVINNVNTSCGCTVAKLPEQPWKLAAGANGQIQATMNLANKSGGVTKTLTVNTDKGTKMLLVKTTILPAPAPAPGQMTDAGRAMNQQVALADRQAVFKGECASCHVEPTRNLMGQALYDKACGICHDAEHRATMVPNLHALPNPTNADYWRNWITHGKVNSLMPAFSQNEGGILSTEQIASLVNYLTTAIPSKSASQTGNPATKTN